jgi:hypothetical protein
VNVTIKPKNLKAFQKTLGDYMQFSSRSLREACNEKAYFIINGSPDTEGAIKLTKKADYQQIKKELGAETQQQIGKRGKPIKKWRLGLVANRNAGESGYDNLAKRIVIARLRKAGKPIPDAQTLNRMAIALVQARIRSVAFFRSGWLPALKVFARYSKYTRVGRDEAVRYGVEKGGGSPATSAQGFSPKAFAWNDANATAKFGGLAGGAERVALPGLEAAIAQEMASMQTYIERKMGEAANAAGLAVK